MKKGEDEAQGKLMEADWQTTKHQKSENCAMGMFRKIGTQTRASKIADIGAKRKKCGHNATMRHSKRNNDFERKRSER